MCTFQGRIIKHFNVFSWFTNKRKQSCRGIIKVGKCSEVEKMKGFTLLHRMSSKANGSCQPINKKELGKIEVMKVFFSLIL